MPPCTHRLHRMPALQRLLARLVAPLAAALLLPGCTTLPTPAPRPATHAGDVDVSTTELAQFAARGAPPATPGQPPLSGFQLLPEGAFAYDARISLIRHARKSLDVQYYYLRKDDAGLQLLRELREVAQRGVRVRLLVDDLFTTGEDELFASFAAFPNVQVRLFNPLPSRAGSLPLRLALSLHEFGRINHRMHNKLLVADNSFAVSGGRNIANEYFMRDTAANFIDIDVLANGPIVREMSAAFDRYWNSGHVYPIEQVAPLRLPPAEARQRFDALASTATPDVLLEPRDALDHPPVSEQLARGEFTRHWAPARLFVDEPDKITRKDWEAYRGSVTEAAVELMDAAREQILVFSPYFIPGPVGMALIRRQIAAGVQVVVVTNSLGATDEPLAYAGYERYRTDMLKIGVRIHEIAPELSARSGRFGSFGASLSRLHGKLALIDHRHVFIGSMNLDNRSAAVNTELGLAIDSPALVDEFTRLIDVRRELPGYRLRLSPDGRRAQWIEPDAQGGEVVHEDVPGRFLWLRLKNWLLLPLVGEDLL